MPKENLIFKLDNLEYQFHYLQDTLSAFEPRLAQTSKLYNVKGRKNQKRLQNKLKILNESDIIKEIDALSVNILDQKIHNVEKHLTKIFHKALDDSMRANILKICKTEDDFIKSIIMSKLVKLTRSKMIRYVKLKQLEEIPNWYENHSFEKIWNNKNHKSNPSHVWNEIILKIDGAAKLISSTMNNSKIKELITGYENGLNVFLGIDVKDKKVRSKEDVEKVAEKSKDNGEDDDKDENDDEDDDDDDEFISATEDIIEDHDIDEDVLKQYDTLLGDSENDDSDGNNGFDDDIDYNEVTDEEASDDEISTAKKYNLPELMTGYYSGDDEEEAASSDDDKVAREQIELPQKKNRRGQRARRRIWAQKYGKEANHVQHEMAKHKEEREKRQRDFEDRVAKRAAKQAKLDKDNANMIPIANEKKMGTVSRNVKPEKKLNENHPSWIAKKQAEAKLKNAKFEGKKITFD